MAGNNHAVWRSSSFCNDNACVEVAIRNHDVSVRRSGDSGLVLTFTHEEWATFLDGVKAGEFTPQPR
jgi:Domain of unknown function (DUF397)